MARGYYKKRKGYYTRKSKKNYGSVSKPIKKYVKKVMSKAIEQKHTDATWTAVPQSSTCAFLAITSLITQGVQYLQRIGDKIRLKKLKIRVQLDAADSSNAFRIIVFRWKQDTSTVAPTAADLLDLQYADGTQYCYLNPEGALVEKKPYEILWDKTYELILGTNTAVRNVFKTINLKDALLQFRGTSVNGVGHLYVMTVSDSGTATHPSITGVCTTYFTDA